MSFLSILKTVGKDSLKVVNAASPIANIFLPGAGTALGTVTGLVIAAENHPDLQAPKAGAAKFDWVSKTFIAIFPMIQAFAKSQGEDIELNTAVLPDLINGVVATLNALQSLHFSMTKVAKGTS